MTLSEIETRPARPAEYEAVAGLRWRWVTERGERPDGDRDEYVRGFAAWVGANAVSHRCLVVVRDGQVIGMGFLAITARVPSPLRFARASGDVQCVYVVPEERDAGYGGQLIDAILRLAAELGLERVTVHSSERAVSAYQRHGFAVSPKLLQAEVRPPQS